MKNAASIQKNSEMEMKVHGMYGSTANEVDRVFRRRVRSARPLSGAGSAGSRTKAKIHPGEAGIVSGRRIRVETPDRPLLRSLKGILTLRGILLVLISGLFVAAAVILMLFNFEYATIHGNTKYSQEQIESFITRGFLGENTFVMAVKYHHRKVTGIPFVDQIDIDIVNPSTIRVNITEKPTDGCIFYKGSNVYFSNDGIIQTVSGRTVEDTTVVNGVVLTHSETGARIQAKNQLGLDLTLELLRAADKYGIRADSIDVDSKSNLTVTFGDVKVLVGKTGFDQKMYKMHQILPYLEGRSGIISMTGYEDDYNVETGNIVLSPFKSEESESEKTEESEGTEAGQSEESGEKDQADDQVSQAETENEEETAAESEDGSGDVNEVTEPAEESQAQDSAEDSAQTPAEADAPAAAPAEGAEAQTGAQEGTESAPAAAPGEVQGEEQTAPAAAQQAPAEGQAAE